MTGGTPNGEPMVEDGMTAGAVGGETGGEQVAPSPCDMTGRWLSTLHYVTDALGLLQYNHIYLYYEIEQDATTFTITRSLQCSDDTVTTGALSADADFSGTWESVRSRLSEAGRTGTSTEVAGGCQIELSKWYMVRGATIDYYSDPAHPMPTADQPATDSTPGWEDWDGDGNPGLTGVVTGVIEGKIFVAPRMWTSMSGTAADVSARFTLSLDWFNEPNVMAYDGSPLLASSAARAFDPDLHFTELARLAADQATGDDATICQSITELAPTLTPTGAGL